MVYFETALFNQQNCDPTRPLRALLRIWWLTALLVVIYSESTDFIQSQAPQIKGKRLDWQTRAQVFIDTCKVFNISVTSSCNILTDEQFCKSIIIKIVCKWCIEQSKFNMTLHLYIFYRWFFLLPRLEICLHLFCMQLVRRI